MNRSVWPVTGAAAVVAAAILLSAQCDLPVQEVREPGTSRLDAFVANLGVNQVYLNDGHGNFTVQNLETEAHSGSSYGVALGDLNGDGHLDAFVVNYGVNHVYLNNGDGTFERRDVTTDNHKSAGVALGDLNGDGHLDAFVANGGQTSTEVNRVYLNNGDGTFEGHDANVDAHRSCAVALGNLTDSLHPDALVVNFYPAPYVVLYKNMGFAPGADPFQGEILYVPGAHGGMCTSVALGDLNWDGLTDAVVGSWKSPSSTSDLVYLHDGSGLDFETGLADSGNTTGIALAYLEDHPDFSVDIFAVHYGPRHRTWLTEVSGPAGGPYSCEFTPYEVSAMDDDNGSYGVALGDLDGDGHPDAFVVNNSANRVYLNTGDGKHFDGRDASSDPLEGFWSSRAVALGDLDGR